MNERFMVDDAGTLIDMETRNTYDYVSDVVDLLNKQYPTGTEACISISIDLCSGTFSSPIFQRALIGGISAELL